MSLKSITDDLSEKIVASYKNILGSNLVGIYLHGSLAMTGFNPNKSDIDFLVVVRETLTLEQKQAVIKFLLEITPDSPTKGLEMSVIKLENIQNLEYPTPFELHYSKEWQQAFAENTIDWEKQNKDPDLAAAFYVTQKRGRTLYGLPIEQVFTNIPVRYYVDSVVSDLQYEQEDFNDNPVYVVLNLCRTYKDFLQNTVSSKSEGAQWYIQQNLEFKELVTQCLVDYQSAENGIIDAQKVEQFYKYLMPKIMTLVSPTYPHNDSSNSQ